MQFADQLLQLLRQGLAAIFGFINSIWDWAIGQINAVPWTEFGQFFLWQQILLVLTAGAVVYLLYRAIRELLDAGKKLLDAFVTLLSVLINSLVPALLAGLIAACGAWAVTNISF